MLWSMTDEQWDIVQATHVNGSFYWLQAVAPGMCELKRLLTFEREGVRATGLEWDRAT